MEDWKDIPSYEGLYQVSNLGKVKSLRFNKDKILKTSIDAYGYSNVSLWNDKKQKTKKVHKLVAIVFLNHIPSGFNLVVDHINNNKLDNSLENLQIITHRENSSKDKKGTSKYTGVSWNRDMSKWQVGITINGKKKGLGYYNNEYKASLVYKNKLKEITINK